MTDDKSVMAVLVEAAENKGMWSDISDFSDEDVECLNQDVMIFRGKAYEFIDRLFQSSE